jgi:GNAT superfamily N-acetyltransferase
VTGAELAWRPLDASHADDLSAINRACPLQSAFTFRFDRDPDFFAWPRLVFDECNYFGGFDGDRLVAYCMAGFRTGWTGSEFGRYGYVGDLRMLPAYRGRGLVVPAFKHVLASVPADVRAGYALVALGNRAAERLVQKVHIDGISIVPGRSVNVVSIPLFGAPRERHMVAIRDARDVDASAIAALLRRACAQRLFAPRHDDGDVARRVRDGDMLVAESSGRLRGVIAWTDLTSVRRTTILRYPASYAPVRAGWGMMRAVTRGMAAFPVPGEPLRSVIVTDLAAEGDDRAVLRALVRRAMAAQAGRGLHVLQVCGTAGEPALESLRGMIRFSFHSHIWLLSHGALAPVTHAPYFDLRLF